MKYILYIMLVSISILLSEDAKSSLDTININPSDTENGFIYEDDFEMKVVRNINNQRTRGWTWYKIMKRLNELDIPTKMRTGKGWTINQIRQVYRFHYESNKPVLIK